MNITPAYEDSETAGGDVDRRYSGAYRIKTRHLIAAGVISSASAIAAHITSLILYLLRWWPAPPFPTLLMPLIVAAVLGGPVVGLACGYTALRRLSMFPAPGRRGALVSVWLGWLSLATFCVTMLTPAYVGEYRCHQSVGSRSNLKAIGVAVGLYRSNSQDAFPPNLQVLVDTRYLTDMSVLRIPPLWSRSKQRPLNLAAIDADADYTYVPLLREPTKPGAVPIAWEKDTRIDGRRVSVLFCDLHASHKETDELLSLLDEYKDYYAATPRPPNS